MADVDGEETLQTQDGRKRRLEEDDGEMTTNIKRPKLDLPIDGETDRGQARENGTDEDLADSEPDGDLPTECDVQQQAVAPPEDPVEPVSVPQQENNVPPCKESPPEEVLQAKDVVLPQNSLSPQRELSPQSVLPPPQNDLKHEEEDMQTDDALETQDGCRTKDAVELEDGVQVNEEKVKDELQESEDLVTVKAEPTADGYEQKTEGDDASSPRPTVKKDKDNMCDEPVDMSTNKSDAKKEKREPSPDVIVLSDNESSSPTANGYCKDEEIGSDFIKSSTPEEREKMIKRLKDELRLEEAKLVLLKKLRQSQMQKENVTQKPAAPHGTGSASAPPPLVRGSQQQQPPGTRLPAQQMAMPRSQGSVVPPPLVRGGQQGPPKFSHHQSSQVVMPPLVRGPQMHGSRPGTAPPPLMMAPRVTTPSQMQGNRGLSSSGLVRVTTVTPPTSGVVNYTQSMVRGSAGGASSSPTPARSESPASRQAAAKLALRKQIEKTLLEIPPPKPPPPELNFLPSAANSEFVYLIGLEEVVQSLLETQGKAAPQPMGREPFKCLQCQTDFTARWRREKGGTVICEQCLSSNQKKALKAEHTNRLKMAFVKALQQEQEIEQQIQQQTVSTPTQNAKSHMQQLPLKQQQSTRPSQSMVQRGHQSQHRGVLHSFPQPPQMQASSKLLGLQGKAQVRPQARPQGGAGRARRHAVASHSAGVNMAYVTPNLSGQHKPSTSTAASPAERQREYLLDMLPSRAISHPAVHRPAMGSRAPSQLSHGARAPMQHGGGGGGASRATAHPQQHGSRVMGHHSQAAGRAVPGAAGSSPSGRSVQQPSANRAVNQSPAHGRSLAQGNAARSVTQPAGSWK